MLKLSCDFRTVGLSEDRAALKLLLWVSAATLYPLIQLAPPDRASSKSKTICFHQLKSTQVLNKLFLPHQRKTPLSSIPSQMPSDLPYHSPSSRSHVISLQHIATLMWKTGSTPNRALISVPVNPFIKVFPVDPEDKFLLPSPMLLSDPLMQYFVTTKMNMNSLCPDRKQDSCCNKRSIFDISLISYKNYLTFALTIFVILYILLLVCHMYVFVWRVCTWVWMSAEARSWQVDVLLNCSPP